MFARKMNFLAHAFLSGNDEHLMFGNFIADSVKGQQILKFNAKVQRGIHLHRAIDQFTDSHPTVQEAVRLLQEYFRKYAPVVLDIYFDHFLARNWQKFSDENLNSFVWNVYRTMIFQFDQLPPRSRRILPWMIAQNWLAGYGNYDQLDSVFKGMARRTSFNSGMENAIKVLKTNELVLQQYFHDFFPELELYCRNWLQLNPPIFIEKAKEHF